MGTVSEGSDGGGIVGDCGVGSIVWVRRRNGSWWPGRILGIEELAESHVISSRSGTPVKLLGREDASVDWYNLEKSKRVKPFRCGEFDACLERAEASHSTPIKKREKYARREDAILHALELEKQLLEMQQENTAISYHAHAGNKTLGIAERESNQHSSEVQVSSILANQESQTSPGKISSLLNECHLDHSLPIHRNRNVKTSISEDDKQEIAAHISVEDVSPEVKSKGKLFLSVGGNSDITDEDHSDLLPHGEHNSGFISQAVIDKNLSVFKRKTSLPGAINDSPAKRRDRRRPLVKVLQNSSKLPVSFSFPPHQCSSSNPMPAEEHLISIAHDAQKNTSIHPSPNADDPLDYSSHSWKHTPADSGNAYLLQQPGCISNESTPSVWTEENDFDSSATDSELEMVEEKLRSGITQPLKQTAESSIESMSHWHLKGKRNNRILSKRLLEYVDGNNIGGTDKSNVQFRETSPEDKATTSYNIGKFDCTTAPTAPGREFSFEKEMDYDTGEEEIFTGLRNRRDDLERQDSDYIDSDDDRQLISEPGWGAMRPFQIWKAYWEDPEDNLDQFYTPFSYRMIPMLIDVELKVQARYQGGHVPLISLTSKLNGMAIIGHPVHIEVLEDGSSGLLLSSNGFGDATAPPIWRTAKRTSMHRLPRLNPDPSDLLAPQMKKTRFYHAHRSASGRFQRKPLKTLSLSSSQKTRALSSFVSEKKINNISVFLGGLIKADGSMPPVTCIPTKVVFTRILESIGRLSAAVPHRALQKEGNLS